MKKLFEKTRLAIFVVLIAGVTACSESENVGTQETANIETTQLVKLDVFKSRSCECCVGWMSHIEQNGFQATTHHPVDLQQLKYELGVAPQYQSCHTGVSKDGYVFEGHIPADVMQRFLSEKPDNALGLAVSGMPMGSPGMEMGDRRDDYDVLLLNKDGSSQVYARIRANS